MSGSDLSLLDDLWINTFTGKKFYFAAPTLEMISIVDIAHALSMQCRYIGHTKLFYSVAEHCVLMCTAARRLEPNDQRQQLQALLHDAAEAYLGDVASPLKYSGMFEGYKTLETNLEAVIARRFKLIQPGKTPWVDELDKLILYDEVTALFNNPPDAWHMRFAPGLGAMIRCWKPEKAYARFMAEYRRLLP